ncbi:hypothetical protein SprV_0602068800 [Sparganum proliferum]
MYCVFLQLRWSTGFDSRHKTTSMNSDSAWRVHKFKKRATLLRLPSATCRGKQSTSRPSYRMNSHLLTV